MINYAHRGASEYAPENTLSSFYLGLLMGANGIETDVQKTKDGVLVLFHDDAVHRVSNGKGKVSELSLEELRKLQIRGNTTTGFYDRIITFEEFLQKFSAYNIKFAIELKGADCEKEALSLAEKYGILDKTTFTSFKFEYINKMKKLCPKVRIGWLVDEGTDEEINKLLEIGGEEIAPKAEYVTKQAIKRWRSVKLGVRAWGVSNVALMKKMCDMKVDGMTVNFPDRLREYLNSKR